MDTFFFFLNNEIKKKIKRAFITKAQILNWCYNKIRKCDTRISMDVQVDTYRLKCYYDWSLKTTSVHRIVINPNCLKLFYLLYQWIRIIHMGNFQIFLGWLCWPWRRLNSKVGKITVISYQPQWLMSLWALPCKSGCNS